MANAQLRTAYNLLLQHCSADPNRHGTKGDHADPCAVSLYFPLHLADLTKPESRFTKEEMQRELLENLYRSSEIEDLLKESDFTIRRRKECQQMVESLSKASEIVSQVQ